MKMNSYMRTLLFLSYVMLCGMDQYELESAISSAQPGDVIHVYNSVSMTDRLLIEGKTDLSLVFHDGAGIDFGCLANDQGLYVHNSPGFRSWGGRFTGQTGCPNELKYMILFHGSDGAFINAKISNTPAIGIGVYHSDDVRIHYGHIIENGFDNPAGSSLGKHGLPSPTRPSIWANYANGLSVEGVVVHGRHNGPNGDGAMSFYNSCDITVDSVSSYGAGSSSIYFVNVNGFNVRDSLFQGSTEFGIDIVAGSRNGLFYQNQIVNPGFGWGAIAPALGLPAPRSIAIINNSFVGDSSAPNTEPGLNIVSPSDVIQYGNF